MTDEGVVIRQRDDFAAYLREHKVRRVDSHMVARDPGRWFWFVTGSDGWIRAYDGCTNGSVLVAAVNHALAPAGIRVTNVYRMRWKKEPQR